MSVDFVSEYESEFFRYYTKDKVIHLPIQSTLSFKDNEFSIDVISFII
jgi:hypothetical protein